MSGYSNDDNYVALFNEITGDYSSFQLPDGAVTNYVLTCLDDNGDAGWRDLATLGVTSIIGTTNQVLANGTTGSMQVGDVILTLPQDIDTTSTPTFSSLTLSTPTASTLAYFDTSKILSSVTLGSNLTLTTGTLDTIQAILTSSSPQFSALKLTTGAASGKVLTSDASGNTSWTAFSSLGVSSATGTINQVLVNGTTSAQTGAITLTLPQDINTTSSPTFSSLTLSSPTINTLTYFNSSKVLSSITLSSNLTLTTGTLNTIQSITTSSSPQFSALKLTTGATNGYLLQSDASGNTSWVAPAVGVSSITGTANQVLANGSTSPQTGAVTLTLPQSIATTSNVQFGSLAIGAFTPAPSNGLLCSGQAGFGVSSVRTSKDFVDIASGSGYALQLALYGSNTTAQGLISSMDQVSLASFGTNKCPASTTVTNSCQAYLNNTVDISSSASIVNSSVTLFVFGGSQSGATGSGSSIGNAYAGYFTNPNMGSTRTALYSDNLAVGYASTSPPTNGAIIQGNVGISINNSNYKLTIGGTESVNPYSCVLQTDLECPGGGLSLMASQYINTFFNQISSNTITNAAQLYVTAGAIPTLGASVTNGYGIYINNPLFGNTSKAALYSDNVSIGYSGVSPPTNGAIISGSVSIGSSSASSTASLQVVSTTKGFLQPVMSTTQKNAITSPATGLMLFDNVLNVPSWFNGTSWIDYIYYTTPFTITWTGAASTTSTMTATRLGNMVILCFEALNVTATASSGFNAAASSVTSPYTPSITSNGLLITYSAAGPIFNTGIITINTNGSIAIVYGLNAAAFTNATSSGWDRFSITYKI